MKIFKKLGVAAAVATLSFAASAGITVDDFSVVQANMTDGVTDGMGLASSVSGATTSILGGQRDVFVEKLLDTDPTDTAGDVSARVAGNKFSYSSAAGTAGRSILKWDGGAGSSAAAAISEASFLAGTNYTGLGSFNLADTGTAFLINVYESDIGFDFALSVYTSATQWTTLVLQSEAHHLGLPASSPIDFVDFFGTASVGTVDLNGDSIPDAELLPSGALRIGGTGGYADMADVGAMTATINWSGGPGTVDLQILDAITVPEPGTLALVGLAMVGLGAARRRKLL